MQSQTIPQHITPGPVDTQLPLYVGNLPPNVDVKDITSFFKRFEMNIGKVELGKSRGGAVRYCFIYAGADVASRILDQVNYKEMGGNEITIMRYNTYPNRSRPELNVFVRGLPEETSSKDLHDVIANLDPKATIESVKVGRDEKGKKLNYGYVNFSKQCEDAVKKLIERKTFDMKGKKVEILKFEKKKSECSNIYMKNFPSTWSKESDVINWIRTNKGEVKNYFFPVIKEGSTEKLKGFGMAEFGVEGALKFVSSVCNVTTEQVRTKFQSDEPNFITKENIYVGKALSRREREDQLERKRKQYKKELKERTRNKNVYVNNFPEDFDDNKLKEFFSKFGNITSAKVMLDENKKSKCFGFVCFQTTEEAKMAIEKGKELHIGGKRLTVNMAQSKQSRHNAMDKQKFPQYQYPTHYMLPQQQFIPPYGIPAQPRPIMRTPPYQVSMPPRPYPGQIQYIVQPQPQPPHAIQPQQPIPQPQPQQQMNRKVNKQITNQLAGKSPEEQRELLGEMIYNIAIQDDPENAPKITGMILELGIDELIYQMESDGMKSKIEEARQVMRENQSH